MPNHIKHSRETRQRICDLHAIGRITLDTYSKGRYTLKQIGKMVGGVNEKVVWNIVKQERENKDNG